MWNKRRGISLIKVAIQPTYFIFGRIQRGQNVEKMSSGDRALKKHPVDVFSEGARMG